MTAACRRRFSMAAFAAGLMISLSACSTLQRLPADERAAAQRDAHAVLADIANTNSKLSSFKGIGRIRVREAKQPTLAERVAWIGSQPDKLAVAVLVAGRPLIRVTADGSYLYAVDLSDPDGSYQKIRTSDPRLDRLMRIPASVSEITAVLAGRIPVRAHSRAFLQRTAASDEAVLVLENWWAVIQKIYLSADRQNVLRFEMFSSGGTLLYRGEIDETQVVQGYRVPLRVRFSTDDGIDLQLDIERYIADVPITPAMFILQKPDSMTP